MSWRQLARIAGAGLSFSLLGPKIKWSSSLSFKFRDLN